MGIRSLFMLVFFISGFASAQTVPETEIFTDLNLLRALHFPILAKDPRTNLAYTKLNDQALHYLLQANHSRGRCAGFEALPLKNHQTALNERLNEMQKIFEHVSRDRAYSAFFPRRNLHLPYRSEIDQAMARLSPDHLRDFVQWASAFPTRDNRADDPNIAVVGLVQKLQALSRAYQTPLQIDLIDHKRTKQKTVRVRLVGASRPQEVVVLGAHFDSINLGWGSSRRAPGADDDASGSANLFDILQAILAQQIATARTIEFYWYAGEESGLLGSAEIAEEAKNQKKQVIGVLQLDMTLYPGLGGQMISSMSDFTSSWLRDMLVAMNETYLKIKIVEDECGYGCSDHASWYRQGYPTLMPFEASMNTMNSRIHSDKDVITNESSFDHAMIFSKIGLIFALELGNTDARQPY